MREPDTAWRALVLAGERAGGDPLARAVGVKRKALIRVSGGTLVEHVVTALRAAGSTDVAISGLDADDLAGLPSLRAVEALPAAASPAASVVAALERPKSLPLLVTTADHPLLLPATIASFRAAARDSGADVAVGVVDAAVVRARFPESRRTYVRFRGRALTGSNLYWFSSPAAQKVAVVWRDVERDRKRPWRMVRRLGAVTLLRFLAGRLTPEEAAAQASMRFGATISLIWLSDATAAVDVDKIADLELATALLSERRAGAPLSRPEGSAS
jgi:molybdopterin-guanine dinucleotide biosynthesis protein A